MNVSKIKNAKSLLISLAMAIVFMACATVNTFAAVTVHTITQTGSSVKWNAYTNYVYQNILTGDVKKIYDTNGNKWCYNTACFLAYDYSYDSYSTCSLTMTAGAQIISCKSSSWTCSGTDNGFKLHCSLTFPNGTTASPNCGAKVFHWKPTTGKKNWNPNYAGLYGRYRNTYTVAKNKACSTCGSTPQKITASASLKGVETGTVITSATLKPPIPAIPHWIYTFVYDNGQADYNMVHWYNEANTIPAAPTRSGYIFKGWMDESGNMYEPGQSINFNSTVPQNSTGHGGTIKTFTAQWELEAWNYSFDKDNGESNVIVQHKLGVETNLLDTPRKVGYVFTGWKDEDGVMYKAGEAVNIDGTNENIGSTIKYFTAQWIPANKLYSPESVNVGSVFKVKAKCKANQDLDASGIKDINLKLVNSENGELLTDSQSIERINSGNAITNFVFGALNGNYYTSSNENYSYAKVGEVTVSGTIKVPYEVVKRYAKVVLTVTYNDGKVATISNDIELIPGLSEGDKGPRYIGNGYSDPGNDSKWSKDPKLREELQNSLGSDKPQSSKKL